jgi:uncharacterized protein YdbL (DUF1318 family)
MSLTDQEKEIVQWGKDNNKSLIETKAALARYRNEQAVKPVKAPTEQTDTSSNLMQKTGDVLGSVFGGEKIGQAIGYQIRKGNLGDTVQKLAVGRDLTPEEEATQTSNVTKTQVVGDVARAASNFLPVGKLAGVAQKGLSAVGLGKVAPYLSKVIAGGATGAAMDVSTSISEGAQPEIGMGTYLGAGIPASSPIIGAIGRAGAKLTGRAASEVTGALTGTSQETVEQAFLAAKRGGKDLDTLTNSLRGKTTPEQLVNSMRENVSLVSQNRSQLFSDTLDELGDVVVKTQPAKDNFKKTLESVGVAIRDDGSLNFANNKLRNVPNAQSKITQAWSEINNMPDTLTIKDLDTTRQAVKAIASIAGDEPSANLGNMLIEDATRSVRLAGEQVDGYGTMLDNFGETNEFLNELNRGLSSGDNATVDQAYRRIATTLKTNNEQRMALVKELDEATGGSLLADISGQQLSEVLPRGIFRQISAGIAGGAAVTGSLSPALLPSLVLASPRVVGEFARSLGIGAAKADALIDAIAEARLVLIKTGAISGSALDSGLDSSNNLEKDIIYSNSTP